VDEEKDKEVLPIHPSVQIPSTQVQDQVDPIVQSSSQVQDNHAQPPQAPQDVLQVRHGRISKDHPIDQIIGSPKGVSTRYNGKLHLLNITRLSPLLSPCV
jgi:hypothetical protein